MAAFVGCGLAAWIITEIVRSVVHRRRVLRTGYGGTQDIAFWGAVVMLVCNTGAIVSLIIWLASQ